MSLSDAIHARDRGGKKLIAISMETQGIPFLEIKSNPGHFGDPALLEGVRTEHSTSELYPHIAMLRSGRDAASL